MRTVEEQSATVPPKVPTLSAIAALTHADVDDAITAGHWTHANPSIALWLNSAFIPVQRDASALIEDLQAHGIAVAD